MRDSAPRRDPGRDRDGPVDARRDHAVDPLRRGQPLDAALVLGRDDRAAVDEGEAGRSGIAVDCDREEPACPRCLEQPELRRAGA
jgi:hypothetical protein